VSAIVTEQLVKEYRGRIRALKGVSLKVERGEIFGLLGQNGAGKTTLIKILLGILSPTAGEASMLGERAGKTSVRKLIGYLPEDHRFPDYHTADSLLQLYGALLEMKSSRIKERADEVLDIVGLKGRRSSKIRTYSKGMKQRLGIAQAIMHEPEIIFLDEPTDGVDPVGRKEIRALLNELKAKGTTIFLNSHLLGEVELICDRVAILQSGEIVQQGDVATLTKQRGLFRIGLAPGEALPLAELKELGYAVTVAGELWEVLLRDDQSIDPLVDFVRQRGLRLRHLTEKRQTLEDLFVQTVELAEPGVDAPRRRSPRSR
jgi:ABC-2 type transport system ATP-binding protein